MSNKHIEWPESLWKATATPLQPLPALPGDMETDLLIVGAGYTGLSTALHALDNTSDITVIDQAQPGWGCSGRNGGQVNPQWKPSVNALQQLYPGKAFDQFIATLDASSRLVFDLIERHNIDCHTVRNGCLIPTRGAKGLAYLTHWSQLWREYGANVTLLDARASAELIGTNAYSACMFDRRGGTVQPLSYARGLAKACLKNKVKLFADTQALSVTRTNQMWVVTTRKGRITCKRLLIATNGYTDKLWPGLAQSIIPVASMLTATRPLPPDVADGILPGRQPVAEYAGVPAYYHIDASGRLVFGWRGTRLGGIGGLNTGHLKAQAVKTFPALQSAQWEYDWAGYVGVTSHQRPMLIRLADNAYAGLGYNGRGITMATMMGRQLAQALNGEDTSVPIQALEKVRLHSFYPLGGAARIAYGHACDFIVDRS